MPKEENKEKEGGGDSQNSDAEDAAQIFPAGAENGGMVENPQQNLSEH